jgi:RNA polymerase sigma factor (TIGR02999 family)
VNQTPEEVGGPGGTSDAFFGLVYEELRSIAHARMRREKPGLTIQTTELVHEAYLRLARSSEGSYQNRNHFFHAAAEAMRRILIERARARGRVKRGGNSDGKPAERVSLDLAEVAALADDQDPETVLAVDAAIERLARRDERMAQVVKLRFYAGLSVEEIAEILETSPRTVQRLWTFARAWLYGDLSRG